MNGLAGIWRLTLLRLRRHPVQTLVLVMCIMVPIFLPVGARVLIADYQTGLTARAAATPMILGAHGNRFDLTFAALYFRQGELDTVPYPEARRLQEQQGLAVPIHARFKARGYPIVGTTPEYFEKRSSRIQAGELPLQLGETLIGADVAVELELTVGDSLFSDQAELYDIAIPPALKMKIVGVLAASQTPEDDTVFVGMETCWILEGLAHGHADAESKQIDPKLILGQDENNTVLSQALIEYNEVTPENIDSFHYHGDPELLPLSAVLFWPHTEKDGTLAKARINQSKKFRMLEPTVVMNDLLAFVLKVRSLIDAISWMLASITALLTLLVFLLSSRLRSREVNTLERLGCSRHFVVGLYLSEILSVLALAATCALLGVWLVQRFLAEEIYTWI
jgi:putative ABC transport system permease protein